MTIKDFYFYPRKLGSMQEDLTAVVIIADSYDINHSENAEALDGRHFTFTPLNSRGKKKHNKPN